MPIVETNYSLQELEQMTDEDLIDAYRLNDKQAIEVLVQRYKQLVRHKIKTTYCIGADKEDLIQEGMIGLFKAINDYNPEREASFKSFATLCVTRQLSTAFKTVTRQKHMPLNTSISLNLPVKPGEEEDEGVTLMDVLKSKEEYSPEDEVIHQEDLQVLNEYISKVLSEMELKVLKLYISGKNYHEIAKQMDKTPKAIDNALQRIKKKLESVSR